MPGPSAWPLASAVFTAGIFLALTVQAYTFSAVSCVFMLYSTLRWLWETDRPIRLKEGDVGGGIVLPITITGPGSHSWWALNATLVVIGMISLMTLFAYLYLYGIHPEVWTPPPGLAQTGGIAALLLLALGAAWLSRRWLAQAKQGEFPGQGPWMSAAAGAGLLAVALYWDVTGWLGTGLLPTATGQGATVFALLAHQGMCVFTAIIMAAYLSWRSARGLLTGRANVTLDVVVRWIGFCALQGLVGSTVLRLFPGG